MQYKKTVVKSSCQKLNIFFKNMFQEQNQKTLEILKKHDENVTLIINDKIYSINQRLDKLTLDINNNPKRS